MPDPGKVASFSGLVRSQTLESVAITPNQRSLPLFAANKNHHKKLQLNIMQKLTDREEPSPRGYIYTTAP